MKFDSLADQPLHLVARVTHRNHARKIGNVGAPGCGPFLEDDRVLHPSLHMILNAAKSPPAPDNTHTPATAKMHRWSGICSILASHRERFRETFVNIVVPQAR